MGDLRIYLDSKFNPVPPAQATLIKVVRGNGKAEFYKPPKPNANPQVTQKAAPHDWMEIGKQLGVDFTEIDPDQWMAGCEHETEHAGTVGGDPTMIAKIARDHLVEDPEYYHKLKQAEL